MALSITNPLSSIHIDPNFRFYKLSINKKKIVDCDDKQILNYFHELDYMHCSLCLSQEKGSALIYRHLTSENHALNGMRSKNFVGFLVEEISALVICSREEINYLFYIQYNNFLYESCLGIADERFITLMNKPVYPEDITTELDEFSATLGDFDLKPENIGTKYSLTAVIEFGRPKSKLFPPNFLLYELRYSLVNGVKYELKTGNTWDYLKSNTITPKTVICSCLQAYKPSLFIEHCHIRSTTCVMEAAIYCCLCKILIVFSSANFLTHMHNDSESTISKLMEELTFGNSSTKSNCTINEFDLKKTDGIKKISDSKLNEDKKIQNEIQEVHVKYKVGSEKETHVRTKVKKNYDSAMITLSKSIFGEMKADTAHFKRLVDTFKVHIYNLAKRQLNLYQVNSIPETYEILFLVCCVCMKICQCNRGIDFHFKTSSHTAKMMGSPPVAIFFPDVGGLVIGKLEDLNYLQHVLFVGMPLLSNIVVGDSESLFIIFYNCRLKKELLNSTLCNIEQNNIKSSLIPGDNHRVKFVQLTHNSDSNEAPFFENFIIFEYFSNDKEESKEYLQSQNLDKFLNSIKEYTFSCNPCGRKKCKFNLFSKHIKGNLFKCCEKCIGLLCHKCKSFTIHSIQESLRHNHNGTSHIEIKPGRESLEKDRNVRKVDIALLEKIDVKEYFDTVNKVCTCKEVGDIKSLTNYLLNALPLKSNVNNVDFCCNYCKDWTGNRIIEMTNHVAYHMKFDEGTIDEEFGVLCDICHVFIFDTKPNLLEVHIKDKHPDYIKDKDEFKIVQDQNNITINLITSFSYNLLESFVEKVANFLNFKVENITVFCMICLKTFLYSSNNFHSHIMECSHQPRTNDHNLTYCKFCNLLLYNDNVKCLANHFNYHSHLIKTNVNIIDETVILSNEQVQVEKSVFKKVALFSSCHGHGRRNKLVLSEFEYKTNVQVSNLYTSLRNMFGKNLNSFHFRCLQCSKDGYNENDCNAHFLMKTHRTEPKAGSVYLVTVCRGCSVILISLSASSMFDHFDFGSHFLNAVLEEIDLNKDELNLMKDADRSLLGYLTKECEAIFTDKQKYDKFLEYNLSEYKRAERGLTNLCKSLSNDIRRVLDGTFPNAVIYFFGSRLSGLAKIKSDIDVFIDVGSADLERLVPLFNIIPGLFHIKQVILGAKVPIIKLEHKNTGLSCDISCRDGYGIYNTHLIKLYLNLDERVYKLCATVLEWAKINGIRGSPKFTSYSLTWMVLFFLMQPEINLIPSVKWLQDRYRGSSVIINGWNCSFSCDVSAIKAHFQPLTNNRITLYELIYNFFKFYALLKADAVLLFPNTGDIISSRWLKRSTRIPLHLRNIFFDKNGEKLIFRSRIFRLMDPFIFNCNIVQNIRKHDLKLFQSLCVHTLRCLEWVKPNS